MHSQSELDAGIVWQSLDNYALLGVRLDVDGYHLLVDGVEAAHVVLCYPGCLRFLDDACFHFGVYRIAHNKLQESLHGIQRCLVFFPIKQCQFLAIGYLEEILGGLVDDRATHVFLEILRVRHEIDLIYVLITQFNLGLFNLFFDLIKLHLFRIDEWLLNFLSNWLGTVGNNVAYLIR